MLIFGPPGLGKTTLAHIVANEMGVNLRHTSGPVLERPGDLAAILTNLEEGEVLFLDEVHRLGAAVEEVLTGLDQPVRLVAPTGDSRVFVVERTGRIRLFGQDGSVANNFQDYRRSSGGDTSDNETG